MDNLNNFPDNFCFNFERSDHKVKEKRTQGSEVLIGRPLASKLKQKLEQKLIGYAELKVHDKLK